MLPFNDFTLLAILLTISMDWYYAWRHARPYKCECNEPMEFKTPRGRQVPLTIHVFAWKRKKSLARLCHSLLRANYRGWNVNLYIHIDGDPLLSVVEYAEDFYWAHGRKYVVISDKHQGLPAAIVESWEPTGDEETFALFLEDDLAVSRAFFDWTLWCLQYIKEHRKTHGIDSGLMGCSLYTPIVDEVGPAVNPWTPPKWSASRTLNSPSPVFYFQLPCSWGVIYSSHYWKKFLDYYYCKRDSTVMIPESRTNEWAQSWKRTMLELMALKGWYLLYPNIGPKRTSFSTNFFEVGVHNQPAGVSDFVYPDRIRRKDYRFTVPLLQRLPRFDVQADAVPWMSLYHKLRPSRAALFTDETTKEAVTKILEEC